MATMQNTRAEFDREAERLARLNGPRRCWPAWRNETMKPLYLCLADGTSELSRERWYSTMLAAAAEAHARNQEIAHSDTPGAYWYVDDGTQRYLDGAEEMNETI